MTRTDAELEIGLKWRPDDVPGGHGGTFDVTLHYDDPQDAGDRREFGQTPLNIDTARLNELVGNTEEYGRQLARELFKQDAKVEAFYGECCTSAETRGYALHLRLLLDPRAPSQYHAVRWEAMLDPRDDTRVATRNKVLFSRYLSSVDWKPVSAPARSDLRALVAVSNPSDLDMQTSMLSRQRLPPISPDAEVERARTSLGDITVHVLPSPVTLHSLSSALDEAAEAGQAIDILYLVCHGRYMADEDGMRAGDSILFLQHPDGRTAKISGRELALRIGSLGRSPTIAVLCSCQSAGDGSQDTLDPGALAAIGPELAKRGVPAVVAMQGNISMESAKAFLPLFFEQVQQHGVVDRAVAAARIGIADRSDWWMPVLFSRLRTGATYYLPDFGARADDVWMELIAAVDQDRCTPVIGSGLSDSILGSREAVAERWVSRWQAPVARHARNDLAMVSQYLRVRTSAAHPANELAQYLMSELRQKYESQLPPGTFDARKPDPVISAVGAMNRRKDPYDPFKVVASIAAPVFFTTGWTNLIEDALAEAGRPPVSRFFDWSDVDDEENNEDFGTPTTAEPLVFHLFGKLTHPESLVLSEDDYFRWLRTWIERREFYGGGGGKRFNKLLLRRTLMFLGYRLDDWDFRVLFQGIKSFGASAQLEGRQHVAVQISRDSSLIEPEAVQDYLESYFRADDVHIYWGEARAFLTELSTRMTKLHAGDYR
jgi:hypothetical protein